MLILLYPVHVKYFLNLLYDSKKVYPYSETHFLVQLLVSYCENTFQREVKGCGFLLPDPICTYWDEENSAWDLTGCQYAGHSQDGETVTCVCNHLTSFGIIFDWQGKADPHESGILYIRVHQF